MRPVSSRAGAAIAYAASAPTGDLILRLDIVRARLPAELRVGSAQEPLRLVFFPPWPSQGGVNNDPDTELVVPPGVEVDSKDPPTGTTRRAPES